DREVPVHGVEFLQAADDRTAQRTIDSPAAENTAVLNIASRVRGTGRLLRLGFVIATVKGRTDCWTRAHLLADFATAVARSKLTRRWWSVGVVLIRTGLRYIFAGATSGPKLSSGSLEFRCRNGLDEGCPQELSETCWTLFTQLLQWFSGSGGGAQPLSGGCAGAIAGGANVGGPAPARRQCSMGFIIADKPRRVQRLAPGGRRGLGEASRPPDSRPSSCRRQLDDERAALRKRRPRKRRQCWKLEDLRAQLASLEKEQNRIGERERQELLSAATRPRRAIFNRSWRSVRDEKEALRKAGRRTGAPEGRAGPALRQAETGGHRISESAKQELSAELARANEQLSGVQAELRKAQRSRTGTGRTAGRGRQRQRAGEAEIAAGRNPDRRAGGGASELKQKTNELKELGEKYDTDCCFLELPAKLRSSAKATEDELQAEKSARNALQTQKTEQERRLCCCWNSSGTKHADACSELAKQKDLESDKSALLAGPEVTSLKKRVSEEAVLKNEAVNKLIRLMQDPTVQKAARSDAMDSGRRGSEQQERLGE
uniref:Kinesin motor domain-containing protein n=1 Tax=Macrostomum lignano TaxID=282301 RepID=A0A1I8JPL4_9PLAT